MLVSCESSTSSLGSVEAMRCVSGKAPPLPRGLGRDHALYASGKAPPLLPNTNACSIATCFTDHVRTVYPFRTAPSICCNTQ